MNRPSFHCCLLLGLVYAWMMLPVRAQMALGPAGLAAQTFNSLPPNNEWATHSVPGSATGVGSTTTAAELDAQVQTNSASLINTPLVASSAPNIPQSGVALWYSPNQFLCTRPTGNRFTLLRATLQNQSQAGLAAVVVSYDLQAIQPNTEQVPGHRVYYSLTGETGTWVHIPQFDSAAAGSQGPRQALLNFTPTWADGAPLFLLFADDNGSGTPDTAVCIDNFAVAFPNVVITSHPQSQAAAVGDEVTLSVDAAGAPPLHYRWFKDGEPIGAATNRTLLISPVTGADAGIYVVAVSNSFGSVMSSNAVLTIGTNPIVILSHPTNVTVMAGAPAQFSVASSGSLRQFQWFRNGVEVPGATNATFSIASAADSDAGLYSVLVSNQMNAVMSSNASLRVRRDVVLLAATNVWRYYATGLTPGMGWQQPGFDDAAWPGGPAPLGADTTPPVAGMIRTPLPLTNAAGDRIITHYFRARFTNTFDAGLLFLSNMIDDGAVFYLNGVEVLRRNMADGPVNSNTFATAFGDEGIFAVDALPADLLAPGENVLAGEVHQVGIGPADVSFAAALHMRVDAGPVHIFRSPANVMASAGTAVQFNAEVSGSGPLRFQWLFDGVAIPEATNSFLWITNVTAADQGIYRLQASNLFGAALSSNAELYVYSLNQPSVTVLNFADEWRYHASGQDLGPGWKEPNYSDAGWSLGRGLFGNVPNTYPEPRNTALAVPSPVGPTNTVYFRAHFDAPDTRSPRDLVFTNLVDDGAVFYINGVEVARVRIPAGPVTYSTAAATAGGNGQFYETLVVPKVSLLATGNILAVEVHQAASTSSDVVFATRLKILARDDDPARIVEEPQDLTVPLGYPATFTAHAFGAGPLHYQWLKNGQPIPGATSNVLHSPSTIPDDAAVYQLRVSNHLNVAFSREATLVIGPETNPPVAIVRGPYLQNATSNSVMIRWRTDNLARSRIDYGTNLAALNSNAIDGTLRFDHAVTLSNLSPNTRYYYALSTAFSNLVAGAEFSFLTPPASSKPTRVWVQGDHGTATAEARQVVNAFTNFNGSPSPDVWLLLGDNAYNEGTDAEYQQALFDFMPDVLRGSLLWTTIGNHETYSSNEFGHFAYLDIFSPPTQAEAGGVPSGSKHYYSFNYGNIHFVCLDSEVANRSTNGAMAHWLREDLAMNDKDWLIAFWHSPPYTHGSHDSDDILDSGGRMVDMRENFLPILEAHGVDLVLNGHSHVYERSRLLDGHYGYSAFLQPEHLKDAGDGRESGTGAYRKSGVGPAPNQGAVYVVAGSSGWATFGTLDHPVMEVSLLEMGSLIIDVNGNRLDAIFLRETGDIDDRFTILKGAAAEPLRIAKFHVNGGQVRGAWKSEAGRFYQVVAGDEVAAQQWNPVGPVIEATGATTFWTNAASGDRLFYRVQQVAP